MVPFLNIPILSVVLVLLAGILIGHLIWYRDRSDDEAAAADLEEKNHQLQCALHEHKQAYSELRQELQIRHEEAAELKSLHQQLQSRWHEAAAQRAREKSDLARVQQLADQAFHDLDRERQQRRTLEDTWKQSQTQLHALTQQLGSAEEAHQALRAEQAQLLPQLEQLAKQNAELQDRLAAATNSRGSAMATSGPARGEIALLTEQVAQQDELVGSLRRERDHLSARYREEAKRRGQLETALQAKEQLLSELTAHAREYDRLRWSFTQSEENLRQLSATVETLTADQRREQARYESELEATRETVHRWQREVAALQESAGALQVERDEVRDDNELLRSRCENLARKLADVEHLVQQRDAALQREKATRLDVESLRSQLEAAQAALDEVSGSGIAGSEVDEANYQELPADARRRHEELERQLGEIHNLLNQRDSAMERESHARGALAQLQTLLANRSEELNALRQECELALRSADEERRQRLQLEEQLKVFRHQVDGSQTAVADARTAQDKVAELSQQLVSQQAQLESIRRDRDEMQTHLADERRRLHDLEQRASLAFCEKDAELHEMQTRHRFAQDSICKLQSELAARSRQFENLRSSLHEMAADFQRERHQREHLQHALVERDARLEQLSSEMQAVQRSSDGLHASLADQQTRWHSLAAERDVMQTENQRLEGMLHSLQSQLDQSHSQLDALTGEVESARAHERQLQDAVQQQVDAAEISAQRCRELQHVAEQQKLLQITLDDAVQRLKKVLLQRDEALATQAESDNVIAELRQQVQAAHGECETLQRRWTEMGELLTHEQHKNQDLSATLDVKAKTIARLQKELTELENLRREHTEVQARLTEATQRLRRIADQREEALRQAETSQQQIEHWETRVRAAEETIRNLRRERTTFLSRQRPIGNRAAAAMEEDLDSANMRRDEALGWVYAQPPKRKDDLKKIVGVADALEKRLNAFGVYTYRQIMQWDEQAVTEFSKRMAFKDRIHREDWIGQARRLYQDRYGRAA